MARKSRKKFIRSDSLLRIPVTVGYIRLSVRNKDRSNSIENQISIIEEWGVKHQTPISDYYIDNGYSGQSFQRPAFQKLLADIEKGIIGCVVMKDLSRLGRDYLETGYYIEIFFPFNQIRLVSINDCFDTVDGVVNKKSIKDSGIRIPLTNSFNEQIRNETKSKMEVLLSMKAENGLFIGPKAPFGYQKSEENNHQLIPDPVASITVKKIFEMAANGTGVTGIVRYLNQKGIPTPIMYAKENGLQGNYNDGTGDWNSRSVKYILTNRTYTGMLIQGKEKRVVQGTHEPLVDTETFDLIQKSFRSRSYNISNNRSPSSENIFKGKVVCMFCGGKMQRKRGTNHADWYFFTCITKNRLGTDRCTGMYAREEDVLNAVYHQLNIFVKEHNISSIEYKEKIQTLNDRIEEAAQKFEEAKDYSMKQYERLVSNEIEKEDFLAARPILDIARQEYEEAISAKCDYETQYQKLRKLSFANRREIPLSDIVDYIDRITVDKDKRITVNWSL